MSLTIAKSRYGQIGVFDERANQVRSLTTAHRDDEILSCSSNGTTGQVVFKERTGQQWVRTYNLQTGQILGNYRLPDDLPKQKPLTERINIIRTPPDHQSGSGGGTGCGLIAFAIAVYALKAYYLPILIIGALIVLILFAVKNNK